jgi:hypothetical protein
MSLPGCIQSNWDPHRFQSCTEEMGISRSGQSSTADPLNTGDALSVGEVGYWLVAGGAFTIFKTNKTHRILRKSKAGHSDQGSATGILNSRLAVASRD